jgi:hypothetical protein
MDEVGFRLCVPDLVAFLREQILHTVDFDISYSITAGSLG